MVSMIEQVYKAINLLPRYNNLTPSSDLPSNGIYIFFERGETITLSGNIDRIVRIGTHKSDGRFKGRIRQHYGVKKSLGGNKNSSVFRKHLGGALLRSNDPQDKRITDWLTQDGPSFREVEELVSSVLRSNFSFSCFAVETKDERLELESALIALMAQYPLGAPSVNWSGKYAASEKIVKSGLWNTQQIDSSPMTCEQFTRFEKLINNMCR